MTDLTRQLRELYKETFGKNPSPATKDETLILKLSREDVDLSFVPKEEPKEELEEIPVLKEVKPQLKEVSLNETHEGLPVSEGRGRTKKFLIYFRGRPRYWTHGSIQAMRSQASDVKFPENTDYTDSASFHKCKSC